MTKRPEIIFAFLVPLLSHLTTNNHSVKNSFSFSNFISKQNSNTFLVSYDVESLFTNVPVSETINIIISKLFPSDDSVVRLMHSIRTLISYKSLITHI